MTAALHDDYAGLAAEIEEAAREGHHGNAVVPELLARRASEIAPEHVRWTWPDWIPAARLSLMSGRPSDGKSTLCLDLIARLTTGSPLPDGFLPQRINCAILSAEDDAADTVIPRLIAAGADLERVVVIGNIRDAETGLERPWTLPGDILSLEARIRADEIGFAVVDPLAAFTSSAVDGHRDADVRRMLAVLSATAERTRCAVTAVRHFRKGGATDARDAGGGSVAYTAACRVEIIVGADPQDPTRRVMAIGKTNLAAEPASLAFRLVSDDEWQCSRVRWEGATTVTAAQLTSEPPTAEARSELDEAVTFLVASLSERDQPAKVIRRQAEEAGISYSTLRRAKDRLGVRSRKTHDGSWSWAREGALAPEHPPLGLLEHHPWTHTQTDVSLSRERPQGAQGAQDDVLGSALTDEDVERRAAEEVS